MTTVVLVEPTGPGLRAIDAVTAAGHRAVVIRSPIYDYLLTDGQRELRQAQADLVLTVPDVHELPAVVAALTGAGVALADVVGVCTSAQLCVIAAAQLAAHLGLPHTPPEALAAAKDKVRCRELLDAAGVPNLAHGDARDAAGIVAVAGRIGYPVVVKPSQGAGKARVVIASTEAHVHALFAAEPTSSIIAQPALWAQLDGRFVVEELALGQLYSVEVVSDGQTWTPLIAVHRKVGRDNPILELGSTVPCGLTAAREAELGDYAVRACRAAGLVAGVFHVEVIATEAGPRLVEINPRIAGGAIPDLIESATGRNLFDILVDISIGRPAPQRPLSQQAGASHSFITVTRDCLVRPDLPDDWFEAYRARIHSGWSTIRAGSRLRRMDGNFDVYGVVRVVAKDANTAADECSQLLAEIGETLAVPMTQMARRPVAPMT